MTCDFFVISRAHFEKLLSYIQTTIDEGAKLVYGGKQVDRPGE